MDLGDMTSSDDVITPVSQRATRERKTLIFAARQREKLMWRERSSFSIYVGGERKARREKKEKRKSRYMNNGRSLVRPACWKAEYPLMEWLIHVKVTVSHIESCRYCSVNDDCTVLLTA
jgi:hypothetical protein